MDWKAWFGVGSTVIALGASAYAFARSGGAAEAKTELRLENLEKDRTTAISRIDDVQRRVIEIEKIPGQLRSLEVSQQRVEVTVGELNRDLRSYFKEQAASKK